MKKTSFVILWSLIGSLAFAMVRYPMSWGLMDDSQNLQLVRSSWQPLTLFQILRDYSSMNGGYFRPLYTFFVYVTYGTFQNHPATFYLLNLVFVIAALWPWALLIKRHLAAHYRTELTFTFAFLLFFATPLYNHITYLSLQEKFVIFFSGWSYYLFDRLIMKSLRSNAIWWEAQLSLIVLAIFGLWGKATCIAFLPWFLFALVFAQGVPPMRRLTSLALWSIFLGIAGHVLLYDRNTYNSKYKTDIHGLIDRIHLLPPSAYFFVALAVGTGFVLFLTRRKETTVWVWPLSLLSYLIVMLPWGINTYYWGPAMPCACGCLVLLADAALRQTPSYADAGVRGILGASALLAIAGVFFIGIPRLKRQSEIGTVVEWLSARLPSEKIAVYVQAPCLEATTALQYYAVGNKQPFHYLTQDEIPATAAPEWWLITRDECVMDSSHSALFESIIYELPHWKVYQHVQQS